MTATIHADAPVPVRDDLSAVHQRALDRLARPGTWFDGSRRLAIAQETRNSGRCGLCRRRKAALSPYAIDGAHESLGGLPEPMVDVIHRVATDPGRLTRDWYQAVLDQGLGDGEYVETVGVVVTVVALDTFRLGLGLPPLAFGPAEPGEPSRYRPAAAQVQGAWVPTQAKDQVAPEDAYIYHNRFGANIQQALSLVPAEVDGFFDMVETQYLNGAQMRDFGNEFRAISHAQIELLAARVSAINQCVY